MRVGSFDRAADFYDATRGLPVDVGSRITDVLVAELADAGVVLEIGVGTGRLALPLSERGVPLVGIDVSAAMLERLTANAGGAPPFPIALADATALPFRDAAFGAVLAGHVFHLIPAWATALDEIGRVLRTGGRLLVDIGGFGAAQMPWHEQTSELLRRHGIVQQHAGATSVHAISDHVRTAPRKMPPVLLAASRTLEQDLADWEGQINSWTWHYPAEQMRAACAEIRAWATATGRPLDEPVAIEHTIQWWAFDRS